MGRNDHFHDKTSGLQRLWEREKIESRETQQKTRENHFGENLIWKTQIFERENYISISG